MNIGSRHIVSTLLGSVVAINSSLAIAQASEEKQQPKTKLESFQRQTGSILVKGYTEIGSVATATPSTAVVEIRCMEFSNPTTKQKQTGIIIETTTLNSRMDVSGSSRAFIDYDEIENLLKGLEYVAKTTPDISKHKNFEVKYETRGGFSTTVFNDSEGKLLASIDIGARSAHIPMEKFSNFRSLILQAREKLDSLR